jgi:hypothetical protein
MQIDTRDKFRELVLYIAKVCANDETFGAIKLNKILFFSDFFAYRQRRESITGASYQRLRLGPAPKCLLPVQKTLIEENALGIQQTERYGRIQKRPVALREPDLSGFKAQEIAIVDQVIRDLWGISAAEASELSHGFWWQLAKDKEEIPIEVSLVEIPDLDGISEQEIQHAEALAPIAKRLAHAG